jgi:putative transposase
MAVVRYIHQNPVKASIVNELAQYRWSSYHAYLQNIPSKVVDTDFILDLFSNQRAQAITLFQEFTAQEEIESIMDMEVEKIREFSNLVEVVSFLDSFCASKKIAGGYKAIKEDRAMAVEVVLELRKRSKLSVRQIAEALGVNRGFVQRIRP